MYGAATGTERPPEPSARNPLRTGVYVSRPLAPLCEAVSDAIGPCTRENLGGGADGTELGPLWRRPELRSRLVQLMADFAAGRRAGRIVALDDAARALASPISMRLGLPMEAFGSLRRRGSVRPVSGGGADGGDRRGPLLVACVLHDGEAARFGDRARGARGTGAGVATVVRITGDHTASVNDDNILSIIDL